MADPLLTPEVLRRRVEALLPEAPVRLWLACSGGLDSTVLTHALARAHPPWPLAVVHVDHRLHPHSPQWAQRVRELAERLGLPCRVIEVEVTKGAGPEDAARRARYQAWEGLLQPGEALATAHHADDQVETVLLRILRGTGLDGLGGMPEHRPLGPGRLLRPLLPWPRAALHAYAEREGLSWIDDPANRAPGLDRNFLRHHVLPLLQQRFPARRALLRLADHAQEWRRHQAPQRRRQLRAAVNTDGTLNLPAIEGQGEEQILTLLGDWFRHHGLPPPSLAQRRRLLCEVIHAHADADPRLHIGGHEIRRYRRRLYLLHSVPPPPEPLSGWRWCPPVPLNLPGRGRLSALPGGVGDLRAAEYYTVRLRRGGERLRLHGHRRALKKCLQQAGIPPWQRPHLPLIYHGDELAAVPGVAIADPFRAAAGEPAWAIAWQPFHLSGEGASGKV